MRLNYTNKEALHSNNTIPDKNKVNDTDMNSIKNAVNQMSMYTKLSSNNDVWEFPGYEGTLIIGSIIPLEIEASTNPSGNAAIKIGDITYSVKDENGNSISAVGFEGQYYFVYNGTNLILKSNGGVSDYNSLSNKPQINSVELSGNKSLDDLGIASKINLDNLRNISCQEKIVGYWTDGAPIYRRKIDINQTINTGINSISHGVTGFRKNGYVKVEGSVIYGNNAYQIPTFANTTSFLEINSITPTNIELMLGSGWNGLFNTGYLDFYYMKDSDIPQS